jgi:hypothetical protein
MSNPLISYQALSVQGVAYSVTNLSHLTLVPELFLIN